MLLTAPLALALSIGEFAADVLAEVDASWERVGSRTLEDLPFRDKNRFLDAYEELVAEAGPGARELKQLDRELAGRLEADDLDPGLAWRLADLRSEVALDLGRERDALDHAWAAVHAYPDVRYANPRAHASFQHLVDRAARLAAEDDSPAELAEAVFDAYAQHGAPAFFPTNGLVETFVRLEGDAQLLALAERVGALWAERGADEVVESWNAELEGLRERLPRLVDDDSRRLYHLLGSVEGAARLVLVLPGGTGRSDDFLSFVTGLQSGVGAPYVFALVDAPHWSEEQASRVVWVRDHDRKRFKAKFGTEDLVRSVYEDVLARGDVEIEGVSLLAWSSGGPTAYSCLLSKRSPFDRAVIHGSIFPTDGVDLRRAEGTRFFLAQGTSDTITPVHHAERAEQELRDAGAGVVYEPYDGGHGWAMPEGSADWLRRALDLLWDDGAWAP